jgi:S-DNA-T family DNA segregation ATPase FtsK/SpoIIIE
MNGAEKLLGRGDMLFLPTGAIKPLRIQGAYVSEEEVEKIVSFIKKQGETSYVSEFPEVEEASSEPEKEFGDPLFADAAKVVIEAGHASVSLLQRRLRVGYARAARLMDILEEKGIVGPYEGAKPRQVLMTAEQFQRYYGK